ncbi:MAG: hypothetical protein J7M25_01545 [Deltaproteobacteria bacterium]|nr:hypothetical protein [Deltaproteobacteria bacterium]
MTGFVVGVCMMVLGGGTDHAMVRSEGTGAAHRAPVIALAGLSSGARFHVGLAGREVASLDRARFIEDNRVDVYQENKKDKWEALALAALPTLVYKPLAIGLAWKYCDSAENKRYMAFLVALPSAGFGAYYSEWYWAGAISTVGDLVGSSLMAWYFYSDHQTRNEPGGSMTKFYAGIGVSAFFWVFDMVMGPVGAMYFNRKLRKRYMSGLPARRIYVTPPRPERGLAAIGPRFDVKQPVTIGYSGRF